MPPPISATAVGAPSELAHPSSSAASRDGLDFLDNRARAAGDEIKYLTSVESALLEEIHSLQRALDDSRKRVRGEGKRAVGSASRVRPAAPSKRHNRRIISVSLRLPTEAIRNSERQQLFDLAVPPKAVLTVEKDEQVPFIWVGSGGPGAEVGQPVDAWGRAAASGARGADHEVRVRLEEGEMSAFLNFSENMLYRVLHYDYRSVAESFEERNYDVYKEVTRRFAQAVCEIYEEGDLIWVHNHHMMLLPGMIRDRLWYAKIGFFLYTAFPSAELFRILPMRVSLLQGVLGADLIGFYSFDYAKQFTAACSQLLGLETTPGAIEADPRAGRKCELRIYPAGVDVMALESHVSSKALRTRITELREQFNGRQIVVSFERLDDSFAGIPLTLLAFEKLLCDNSELVQRVVLVQIAMLPRGSMAVTNEAHRALVLQINHLVGSINATYGSFTSSPVHYINTELDPSELHAMMCAAHVCVVSKLRDGMALVPHLWTIAQHGGYKGPIVLSEFSGSARSFSTALLVNPWDVEEMSGKLKEALDMGKQERLVRNDAAYRFVSEHTATMWGANFLEDLEQVEVALHGAGIFSTPPLDTNSVIKAYRASCSLSAMSSPISSTVGLSQLGGGIESTTTTLSPMSTRSVEIDIPMPPTLTSKTSTERLSGGGFSPRTNAKKKLFILDYEGTLMPFQPLAEAGAPSERLRCAIATLLNASIDNVVMIMSGHGKRHLTDWFGDLDVYLAAEDGCFLRQPGDDVWMPLYAQSSNRRKYLATTDSLNDMISARDGLVQSSIRRNDSTDSGNNGSSTSNGSRRGLSTGLYKGSASSMGSVEGGSGSDDELITRWKSSVRGVMEHFAERTPGVLVAEGDASLTWHYVDADREFGRSQARALLKHLESYLCQNLNLNIVTDEGRARWLKARPVGIDRADAVYRVLELVRESGGRSNCGQVLFENNCRVDFLLCAGDDRSDEDVFELLRDEKQRVELGISAISSRIFTVRIGGTATAAMGALDTPTQLLELLEDVVRRTYASGSSDSERNKDTSTPKSAP